MENKNIVDETRAKSVARLKELRAEREMSMDKFAKMLGVAKTTLFQWEKGNRDTMKTQTIKNISEKCHVSALWLMGFDVPKEPESPEHIALSDELSNELIWLTYDELQMVKKFIDDFIKPNRKK